MPWGSDDGSPQAPGGWGQDVPPQGYMPNAQFSAMMDETFGKGHWRSTGGWRSQQREDELRQQGANTVRPGAVSPHSLGAVDAPGAHDVVVPGMSPAQVAGILRERYPGSFKQLYPEAASGTQGPHLHAGLVEGARFGAGGGGSAGSGSGATGWGNDPTQGSPDGAYSNGMDLSWMDNLGISTGTQRVIASAIGGLPGGLASLERGIAGWADLMSQSEATEALARGSAAGYRDPNVNRQLEDVARTPQTRATELAAPSVAGLRAADAAISPSNRSGVESFAHGAGESVAPMAAALISPTAGAAAFGAEGYGQGYDEAIAAGADAQTAQAAGAGDALIQGGIGMLPVGKAVDPLVAGIKAAIPRVAARYGLTAAGEGAMGAGMQIGSNVVAEQFYDPSRPWYEHVPESALSMAGAGFALHGVHDVAGAGWRAATGRLRQTDAAPTPQQALDDMPAQQAAQAYGQASGQIPESRTVFGRREVPPSPIPESRDTFGLRQRPPPGDAAPAPAGGAPPAPRDELLLGPALDEHVSNLRDELDGEASPGVTAPLRVATGDAPILGDVDAAQRAISQANVMGREDVARAIVGRAATEAMAAARGDGPGADEAIQGYMRLAQHARESTLDRPQPQAVPQRNELAPPDEYEEARRAHGAPISEMAPAIADVAEWRGAAPRNYSLSDAIRELGGIKVRDANGDSLPGPDVLGATEGRKLPGLINNKSGLSPEGMFEALRDRGWFGPKQVDASALEAFLRQEARGVKHYHPDATTREQIDRRDALEQEISDAGVTTADSPAVAASKLAAFRSRRARDLGAGTEDLRRRAADLGITVRADASFDEILVDVLEREAIRGEASSGAEADRDERFIDDALTPEEHEWLTAAGGIPDGEPHPGEPAHETGQGEAPGAGTQARGEEPGEGPGGGGAQARAVPEGATAAHVDARRLLDLWDRGRRFFATHLESIEDALHHNKPLTVTPEEWAKAAGGEFGSELADITRWDTRPADHEDWRQVVEHAPTGEDLERAWKEFIDQLPPEEAPQHQAEAEPPPAAEPADEGMPPPAAPPPPPAARQRSRRRQARPEPGPLRLEGGELRGEPDADPHGLTAASARHAEYLRNRFADDAEARRFDYRETFPPARDPAVDETAAAKIHADVRDAVVPLLVVAHRLDEALAQGVDPDTGQAVSRSKERKLSDERYRVSEKVEDALQAYERVFGAAARRRFERVLRDDAWHAHEPQPMGPPAPVGDETAGGGGEDMPLSAADHAQNDRDASVRQHLAGELRRQSVERQQAASVLQPTNPVDAAKAADEAKRLAQAAAHLESGTEAPPAGEPEAAPTQADTRNTLAQLDAKDAKARVFVVPHAGGRWRAIVDSGFGTTHMSGPVGGKEGFETRREAMQKGLEAVARHARNEVERDGVTPAQRKAAQRALDWAREQLADRPNPEADRLANGTVEQEILPGTEASARQAAAARDGPLRARKPQEPPGDLFGPKEPDQGDLGFEEAGAAFEGPLRPVTPLAGGRPIPRSDVRGFRRAQEIANIYFAEGPEAAQRALERADTAGPMQHEDLRATVNALIAERTGSPTVRHQRRFSSGPFEHPAADMLREHFDQNHADLYRLAEASRDQSIPKASVKAEAERLAVMFGRFMDWTADVPLSPTEVRRVNRGEDPTPEMMLRAARDYKRVFDQARRDGTQGSESFYDPEMYGEAMAQQYKMGEGPKFQRGDKAPIFYSAVERAVSRSPMTRARASNWMDMLNNARGVKREELEWLGIKDWLDLWKDEDGKPVRVPRDAVEGFLRNNGVQVEEVTTGRPQLNTESPLYGPAVAKVLETATDPALELENDGDAYREIMRKRPDLIEDDNWPHKVIDEVAPGWAGAPQYGEWTTFGRHGGQDYHELLLTLPQVADPPSTHWDTRGVMAHVRFNTRRAPDGKKVLFLEEIQSDWHQKGRDRGYATATSPAELERLRGAYADAGDAVNAAAKPFNDAAVPLLEAARPKLEQMHLEADARLRSLRLGPEARNRTADENRAAALQMHEYEVTVRDVGRVLQEIDRLGTLRSEPVRAALVDRIFSDAMDLAHPDKYPAEVADVGELRDAYARAHLASVEARQALEHAEAPEGIPDAPFKTTWPDLVLKRMIRWAVDHGYDRVSWATGDQVNKRFSIGSVADELHLVDNGSGGMQRARLEGPLSNATLRVRDNVRGGWHDVPIRDEADLREHVGDELAARLLAQPAEHGTYGGIGMRSRRIAGADMEVGGKGNKAFYDRNLVNKANDLVTKHGSKVTREKVSASGGQNDMREGEPGYAGYDPAYEDRLRESSAQLDEIDKAYARAQREALGSPRDPRIVEARRREAALADLRSKARRAHEDLVNDARGTTHHGFDITPALRDAAEEGQPLFQKAERAAKGRGPWGDDTRRLTMGLRGQVADPVAHAALITKVHEILARLAPFADRKAMEKLVAWGDPRMGSFDVNGAAYAEGLRQVIAWSVHSPDAVGTARHEAVHALSQAGLFKFSEWHALEDAAQSLGWMDKHHIAERYPDLEPGPRLEEAIADEFADWRATRDRAGWPSWVNTLFNRLDNLLRQVGAAWNKLIGRETNPHDVFAAIDAGRIGKRLGDVPANPATAFARPPIRRPYQPETVRDAAYEEAMRGAPPVPPGPRDFITRALGEGADAVGARLNSTASKVLDNPFGDVVRAVRMGTNPMGEGSPRAQAAAKDFANALREVQWEHARVDRWLEKTFTPEERREMYNAADEERVMRAEGRNPGLDEGKNRLPPRLKGVVDELQRRADAEFARAQALGMTKGEGQASYVPAMVVDLAGGEVRRLRGSGRNAGASGTNLTTTTGSLRQRRYGTAEETEAAAQRGYSEGATVVRDIRTLNLATSNLAQAVAGRRLIEHIKRATDTVGDPVVSEGGEPTRDTFSMPEHPAMVTWKPKLSLNEETGKWEAVKDANGQTVFDPVPLRISKEFEGPLKAVLNTKTGPIYNAVLGLKSKAMSVIMYSPMMHNAVVWGKAIPADPVGVLTFGAYLRGNRAKNDPNQMREALQAGLDPVGKRYANQDITAIAEHGSNIAPGQSWTAKVLAAIPNLFSRDAGDAVKRAVDRAGDVWHNTFLWDRVADLQMGLYTKIRDEGVRHGLDAKTAQRMAADFANLYAGSLPIESMSKGARMMANTLLFSRSFTLGNMSAYTRISHGLPSEVQAQIERDSGPIMKAMAQGEARRKAIAMLAIDIGTSYLGLVLAAGATAFLAHAAMQFPWNNEEGKENRFLIGYQPDGTAIYGRLPTGKVGEELVDWPTEPWEMAQRKLSPAAKVMLELAMNDKGFGRKIYLPNDPLAKNVGRVLWHVVQAIAPDAQLQGAADLITGDTDQKTAALRAFLPFAGITVSRGAPGGPAVGDMYRVKDRMQFQFDEAKPDLQRLVLRGDVAGARQQMTALGVSPGLQNYYVRVWKNPRLRLSPRAIADVLRGATPDEKARFEADRAADQARQAGQQPDVAAPP